MVKSILSLAIFGIVAVSAAWGQIPPGYEVVKITDDPADNRFPRMNNCGEVVFHKEAPGGFRLDVFLYDNGKTTQHPEPPVGEMPLPLR